jgi:NAD(P)-dependent dehydrogenase (short-subunit alcohol dehydrogenase family)
VTTYLITGANRGLGLALTQLLAERKDNIIATTRSMEGAEALQKLAAYYPDTVRLFVADVTDTQSVVAFKAAIGNSELDVLVNNAGTIGPKRQSTLDMDFDGFLETLNTNTLGPLRVTQAMLPLLRMSAAPKIVTISSRMGSMGNAESDRIAYRASKAAVNKIMQALGTDLTAQGIATLTMHPGWVRTDMGGSDADLSIEDSIAGIIQRIDGLNLSNSGRFLNYNGSLLPW